MGFSNSNTARRTALAALAVPFVAVAAVGAGAMVRRPPAAVTPHTTAAMPAPDQALPATLAETGLYADPATRTIAPANRPFTPQYPLWSDGARKQRWIFLPPGAAIDGTAADAWQFPVGTKLWKQFAFDRPVETRYMERTAAGWRFATYAWSEDGTTATLAPARGTRVTAEVAPGITHQLPSESDCRVCHGTGEGGASPVLGFSALQLSSERDPGAVHREPIAPGAIDLATLVGRGELRGYRGPAAPRIPARSNVERAALGYLHGNCGSCHRRDRALSSLDMVLAASVETGGAATLATTVAQPSRFAPERPRIAPGEPERSVLVDRMRARTPVAQMPPFGSQLADAEAVRLIARWIDQLAD